MWVVVREEGSEEADVGAVELQDVRCLTWAHSGGTRQSVVFGANIQGLKGTTVTGVIPLPVGATGTGTGTGTGTDTDTDTSGGTSASASASVSASASTADDDLGPARVFEGVGARELHGVLEMCKLCFPSVVRDEVLVARQEGEASDGDASDGEDDSDADDAAHADRDGMGRLAAKHVREEHEERQRTPSLAEAMDVLRVMTVAEASEAIGGGEIAALLEQNEYLGADALLVVAQWTPSSDEESFALAFDVRLSGGSRGPGALPSWTSTRPVDDDLAGAGYLEPVTRRMDHHLFSVNTEREPAAGSGLAGAGKNGAEMLKDMKLRHASGARTTIVEPHYSLAEVARALSAPLAIPHAGRADLRLRRLVGCWNTVKDLAFQLAV